MIAFKNSDGVEFTFKAGVFTHITKKVVCTNCHDGVVRSFFGFGCDEDDDRCKVCHGSGFLPFIAPRPEQKIIDKLQTYLDTLLEEEYNKKKEFEWKAYDI